MIKKYQASLGTKTIIKDQSLLRHEDIKQHILVLPELAAYIPPLLPDEYKQLEENIRQNGCREALLIWETTSEQLPTIHSSGPIYALIDGHNRYEICQRNKVDFKVHLMSFASIDEVKFFMIDNQLGRRNLSPEQVSYLRGLRYLREKREKGKYSRDEQKGQNDLYATSRSTGDQEVSGGEARETTAHKLGKQFNVSEKTIKRDAAFAQGLERLTPSFKQDILSSKVKVDKSLVQRLGQLDEKIKDVNDLSELERISQMDGKSQPLSKNSNSISSEKTVELKHQLHQLVGEMDDDDADILKLCDQIIEHVQRFRQTL